MIGERKTILVAQAGKDYLVMVNPKIVDHSRQCYETEESCLSLTGQRPVKRYSVIVVEYLDRKFKRKKQTFRDFEAQIIQHEMDHFEESLYKAIPHKERLATLHAICLQISRHISQKCS